jgi:hypothetical protein
MTDEDRPLPQSIGIEKQFLASVATSWEQCKDFLDQVSHDCFYSSAHREIYSVLLEMRSEGMNVDQIVLWERIKLNDKIDQTQLMGLFEDTATSPNPKEWARLLNEQAFRRKAISTATSIKRAAHGEIDTVEQILNMSVGQTDSLTLIADEVGTKEPRRGKIVEIASLETDVLDFYDSGFRNRGVKLSWERFTKCYRPCKGTLNTVTGIPSMGKSEVMDAIMLDTAMNHNWKWAVFSPENYPYEIHIQKLLEKLLGYPFHGEGKMTRETVKAGIAFLTKYFYILKPSEDKNNIDSIEIVVLYHVGEPLRNSLFYEIVAKFKDIKPSIFLKSVTNETTSNKSNAIRLVKSWRKLFDIPVIQSSTS